MTSPTNSRRRSPLRKAIIAVLILVLVFVVADRAAAAYAAYRVTSALEQDAGGAGVSVQIGGFPVLTQFLSESLQDVALQADSITYDGLTLQDVSGQATDLDLQDLTFGSVTAEAVIPTSTMQSLMDDAVAEGLGGWELGDVTLTTADDSLTLETKALGMVDLAIDVDPVTHGRSLGFTLTSIRMAGATVTIADLPLGLDTLVDDGIALLRFDLDMLPEGLQVSEVSITDLGASVTLSGVDVALAD